MNIRGGYEPKNNFDDNVLEEILYDPMEDIDIYFPLIEENEVENIIKNEPKE